MKLQCLPMKYPDLNIPEMKGSCVPDGALQICKSDIMLALSEILEGFLFSSSLSLLVNVDDDF